MGLRRGRPVLTGRPTRRGAARARSLPGIALALALVLAGCGSTQEITDEDRYELYSENSRSYYDRGAYQQALQQANKALELEPDDVEIQLIKAFCLLKIGKTTNNPLMLDEALDIFEAAANGDGDDDYRTFVGLGSACLARSFEDDREIARIRKRLASDFLSADARRQDEEALTAELAARQKRLVRGEEALRTVLEFELQKDNAFAMVDLVLVLNSLGGRDAEALVLADRALAQLDESTRITQTTIQKNTKLSSAAKLNLEQRISSNRDKEVLIRDLVATVNYNNGDYDAFFAEMAILEQRKLMGEVQYYNRADVHEQLKHYAEAAADLEAFLRLRVMRMSYDQDTLAPAVFKRMETLRAKALEQKGASASR